MSRKSIKTTRNFSATLINRLRNQVNELSTSAWDIEEGLNRSLVDPQEILAIFPTLKLREEFCLIAYQYRSGGNGNGVVFLWPKDTEVPDLRLNCNPAVHLAEFLKKHLKAADKKMGKGTDIFPEHIMSEIQGDGSPLSYLHASILARELEEFGAMWHGCSWSTDLIVDKDPFAMKIQSTTFGSGPGRILRPEDWSWQKEVPQNWAPAVTMTERRAVVEFITYSGLGQEALYLHRDTYTKGNYDGRSTCDQLASGPMGYVF